MPMMQVKVLIQFYIYVAIISHLLILHDYFSIYNCVYLAIYILNLCG